MSSIGKLTMGGGGGIVQVGLEVNVTTQQVSHEIINFLYMDARYDLLGFESFLKWKMINYYH